MAELTQIDWTPVANEAKVRALLEDFAESLRGAPGPQPGPMALAVWFEKSPDRDLQNLLLLFVLDQVGTILPWSRAPLSKTGQGEPPYVVQPHATSVAHFAKQLSSNRKALAQYFTRYEVLYFDKHLLNEEIFRAFNIVTQPPGLMKGWYVRPQELSKFDTVGGLLGARGNSRPTVGIVKIEESQDFSACRGLVQVEFGQKWVPVSPEGIRAYTYYNDSLDGQPGYFLFEGGALYEIVKFEVKTAPEYCAQFQLLEHPRDDRYPEIYLRAVRLPT